MPKLKGGKYKGTDYHPYSIYVKFREINQLKTTYANLSLDRDGKSLIK